MKVWSVIYEDMAGVAEGNPYAVGVYATEEQANSQAQAFAIQSKNTTSDWIAEPHDNGWHTQCFGDWLESWTVKEHDLQLPEDNTPKLAITKAELAVIVDCMTASLPIENQALWDRVVALKKKLDPYLQT